MPKHPGELVHRIFRATAMTYQEIGRHAGVSGRTVQRWVAGQSHPIGTNFHRLAAVVHPRDPVLAADIAAFCGTTLEALGVVRPEPTAAPALAPARPTAAHAETVVYAAAEAMDVSPRAIRPALAAAFARAAELGFTASDFALVLAEKPAKPAPKPPPKPRKG